MNFYKTTNKILKIDIDILRKAFNLIVNKNGIALLSEIGEAIRKLDASFDPRTYGFKNNSSMFKSLKNDFEIIYHDDKTIISIKDIKSI